MTKTIHLVGNLYDPDTNKFYAEIFTLCMTEDILLQIQIIKRQYPEIVDLLPMPSFKAAIRRMNEINNCRIEKPQKGM